MQIEPAIESATKVLAKYQGKKTTQDIQDLIPSFFHLDHEKTNEGTSNDLLKALQRSRGSLRSNVMSLLISETGPVNESDRRRLSN